MPHPMQHTPAYHAAHHAGYRYDLQLLLEAGRSDTVHELPDELGVLAWHIGQTSLVIVCQTIFVIVCQPF